MSDGDIPWTAIGTVTAIIGVLVAVIGLCNKYLLIKCRQLCRCCPCVNELTGVQIHEDGHKDGNEDKQTSALLPPQDQDENIRKYLLNRQKKLCCNANRFTPATLNSRCKIDIAQMFTDLDLLKENENKQDAKPQTMEEVLEIIKTTPACKVLIEGEGGIGKTTLLRYLAYNWATKESDETFKGKMVFPVNIRDMNKGEDILDVIVKQMKLKDFNLKTNLPEDPKLIKRFIVNHDDEIVLLLDGLDELRDGNESPISLFKKQELEKSIVILTSRSENIDEFITESSVHVKVNGFNADNIRKYIEKHFACKRALGYSLIKELQIGEYEWRRGVKHKEVYSMCKNPMLLLSVCTMWEEGREHLPVDKADLFKVVFQCILNQFIDKEAKEPKISKFEHTPKKFVNAMLLLGKCMYGSLKRNQLSINKKDLDGNKQMVALALKLGFVYRDAPNLKADFEEVYTAPHKLIVESLVGFYLYKLCQKAELESECTEDMAMLLKPLDDNEWKKIRESEYLQMARVFAIGFLGADAGKFLNHWITDSFSTYRSLMTYLKLVKEEKERKAVEKVLIDHMTMTDLEIKPHIDDICKSLRRFIQHINPDVEVNEGEHFIQLMRRVHDIGPRDPGQFLHYLVNRENVMKTLTPIKSFCDERSFEEKGRMFAHILIAVPDQQFILKGIHEVCVDDDVKYLTAACQKLDFKYDITKYELYNGPTLMSASFLVHLLINAPKLTSLTVFNCITCVAMNDMMREYSSKGVELELERLNISANNLTNIDISLLTSLMAIAPKLNHLNMSNCSLSDVTMNDVTRECSSRGVELLL